MRARANRRRYETERYRRIHSVRQDARCGWPRDFTSRRRQLAEPVRRGSPAENGGSPEIDREPLVGILLTACWAGLGRRCGNRSERRKQRRWHRGGSGYEQGRCKNRMTTLVTGAAGFLGSHLTRQLVARGEDVRVLMRASSTNRAIADLSLEYVTGDLREPASLERAMNAAKRAGVEQLIYTSTVATIAVDRPQLPNEFTDAKLKEMVGHYKRSKWMAEKEALKAAKDGLPVIVAMPTTPVGPWDWKPTPTGKIVLDFLNGKMPGYVETGLNFVGVEECAAGHLLVAEKGKIGERYLLGGENLTLKQVLDTLSKITRLPAPKLKIPHRLALGVAYANTIFSRLLGRAPGIPVEGVKIARHMMFVDCARAQRELGFKGGPVAGALERAVRWYEANGYIVKSRAKRMARAAA